MGLVHVLIPQPITEHWDCLQYAVDNKCPGWKEYAKRHAEHLR